MKGNNTFVSALYSLKVFFDIIITRLTGTRIVWTIHNQVSHDSRFPRIEIFTYRMISKLVNAAILRGNSLKDIILKEYQIDEKKLSIINLGNYRDVYPLPIEKWDAREKLLISTGVEKVFLHQGLLKPYKGIEDLIQVWNERANELRNHLLIIAGKAMDEDYEFFLNSLISNNKTIQLISRYVTDEEITTLYCSCDVVVLPFRIMASSSLMVAISFGKPVIAPRLGACEEMLGDATDLLYNSDESLTDLKESINKSTEIDLIKLSEKTKLRADFYDWNYIAMKLRNVYDITLNEK